MIESVKENIAIDIINSFEVSQKIYRHDKLLNNFVAVIEKTINLNEYGKLKWKEKKEVVSVMIKAISKLAKISENTVPHEAWANKDSGLKGIVMMNFEDEGWNYYNRWVEMKFPDVFYNEELHPILQATISDAMKNTKFDALLIRGKQTSALYALELEETFEHTTSIEKASVVKNSGLIHTTAPGYLAFNLYPGLDNKNTELEKQSSNSRLYPDLEGYDLTPSILKGINN